MNNDIQRIKSEISKLENLVAPLEEYLIENPEDLAVKLELKSFQKRMDELNMELGFISNDLGLTTFDFHVSNVDGGRINAFALSKLLNALQNCVNYCALYDGIHPVQEDSSSSNVDLLNNTNLDIASVQSGSLKILVSASDSQTKFGDTSDLKTALKYFNDIIKCNDDENSIYQLMEKIGMKPIFGYKELLKVLTVENLNLDMYSHVKPLGFETQKLSNEFANKVFNTFSNAKPIEEQRTILTLGKVYYINMNTKKFGVEIKDENTNKINKIYVKFLDKDKHTLKESLDLEIKIKITKTIKTQIGNKKEDESWDLVEIL